MRLNDIQDHFKTLMLSSPDALSHPEPAFAEVFATGPVPLNERLGVYRNNIMGNTTNAVLNAFPTLEKLVGRQFLDQMAKHFILQNPPARGCLNGYIEGFDAFVAGYAPAKNLPYLVDMARLEIAIDHAYYARDDAPLKPEDLARVVPETLGTIRLPLRASATLLRSDYPLLKIRDFCDASDKTDPPDMTRSGGALMVLRPALDIAFLSLSDPEFTLLDQLSRHTALGDAVEETLSQFPSFNLATFLQKFIALETFAAFAANGPQQPKNHQEGRKS